MTSVREEGIIKIFAEDNLANTKESLFEGRTETHFPAAAKTNLTLAPHIPYGLKGIIMMPQSYLRIYLNAVAADTLDHADMYDSVIIPITLIRNSDGMEIPKELGITDVSLAAAATTVAGADIVVLEYQIPYGYHAVFGIACSEESLRSRLLIIPMDDSA